MSPNFWNVFITPRAPQHPFSTFLKSLRLHRRRPEPARNVLTNRSRPEPCGLRREFREPVLALLLMLIGSLPILPAAKFFLVPIIKINHQNPVQNYKGRYAQRCIERACSVECWADGFHLLFLFFVRPSQSGPFCPPQIAIRCCSRIARPQRQRRT